MCQLPTTEIPVMLKVVAEKVQRLGAINKSGADAAGVIPPVEPRAEEKRRTGSPSSPGQETMDKFLSAVSHQGETN
jgi:hypothetical protein